MPTLCHPTESLFAFADEYTAFPVLGFDREERRKKIKRPRKNETQVKKMVLGRRGQAGMESKAF